MRYPIAVIALIACACGRVDAQLAPRTGTPRTPSSSDPTGSIEGGTDPTKPPPMRFPQGCLGNEYLPTAGEKCTGECANCDCTAITYTCDKACYDELIPCFINSDPSGKVGPGYPGPCGNVVCEPDSMVLETLTCHATMCTPPGGTTSGKPCTPGTMPGPDAFGTKYECYGITSTTGEVWQLDKVGKKVSLVCNKPASLGPIEAFAISPVTGNAFIIAQDTSDFGKFIPREGSQTCVFTPMGKFPSASIGGFAFSPDGTLYAADESSGQIWKFQKSGADPIAGWDSIGTLPSGSEGLAINPKDGLAYSSNGSTLDVVSLGAVGTSLFSCPLGGGGFESIFFDRDGVLYSTNNMTNEFVSITVDRAAGTCTVSPLFSVLPATELEASDCNTGCAYDTCVCR